MCSKLPATSSQVSAKQYPCLLLGVQFLVSSSVLNLPDIILATTVLFERSKLLTLDVSQSGLGWVSVYWVGLRYWRDTSPSVSDPITLYQKFIILVLIILLNWYLVGGLSKRIMGWGSWYFKQRSLSCWNQDLADLGELVSACLARMLSGSVGRWQIIENNVSCLAWRSASPGKLPARKSTAALGVFWWSLCEFCTVFLIVTVYY